MAQQPGRRLMIRQMILDNFKSYAGPQTVGPFHKSFSSVVGPNGSGKSNVIDAMLFVFGRRAKQLRFNKVSELIHNSTNFQNLAMAKVTVFFQEIIDKEGEEFEVIPGTEFTIARTAHRNNTSDYYINDRKASTKEVTDKLKGHGIDLDNNRFLILQGEVEQISMMKPKAEDKNETGLLEYLEDIIGTDQYKQPIEEAKTQLDAVSEKRQGLVQRLKIAEKEREQLEEKKAEAELFLTKQAEMYQARVKGTMLYISTTEEGLSKVANNMTELQAKLEYERNKAAAQGQESKDAEKRFEEADKAARSCQSSLDSAEAEFKAFERKDAKGQIEIKEMQDKVKKLATKLDKDAAAAKKAEAEAQTLQEETPVANEQLAKLQQDLAKAESDLEAEHESLRGEVDKYHQQLSQVRKSLAPWEKKVGEATGRIAVATTERDTLARRTDDARKRLDAAVKALAAAQQGASAREKHIKELEAAIVKCKSDIEAQRTELSSCQSEEGRLEGSVRELRERVSGLRADSQGSAHSSQLVTALMTARAKGELKGVYGRLGDLGAIDSKFDIAVSTAVGALDYIVVDTTSDAQRTVEYLRKNNLGVATCLILEKQQHLKAHVNKKIDTPEGCPRLFDLIKVKDDKLLPAFYFACGNTLVAQDLDQAARIAYGQDTRFRRVVTLQGQLIAESGTMSGGAGRPSRGRMALGSAAPRGAGADAKAIAAELKTTEAQLEEASSALSAARNRCEACSKALKASEKQLAELELAAPKARMEADAEMEKARDIQQRMDSLKAATQMGSEDAARIAALSQDIAREEQCVASLKKEMQGLEKQAADLQTQIDNAGGEKLKKAKARVAKLQKETSDLEAEISRKAVQLKACQKLVDKVAKDREKDEKERTRLEGAMSKLQQELKDMEDQALKVMELRETTKQELEVKMKELEEARQKLRDINHAHEIIRKTEMEIESKLQELAKLRKEEEAKVKKWQSEIDHLHHKASQLSGGEVAMVDRTELEGHTADEFMLEAGRIEAELVKLSPDMESIEQWRVKDAEFRERAARLDEANKERDEVRQRYDDLRKRRLEEFMAGFEVISSKLKEMYQMITLGGDAELDLVETLDPFSEGISFSVRPPKKSWKNIRNLSGGEKTLSSLSLVFALHHYKPTPLYVMDEIDAALDFKNVSIVAHYIKERTKNAQFIIISLRNNMFELADRLVGIYKTDNTTKTVTINPGNFVKAPTTAVEAGA